MVAFDPTKYGAKPKNSPVIGDSDSGFRINTTGGISPTRVEDENVNRALFRSKPTDSPIIAGLKATGNLPPMY